MPAYDFVLEKDFAVPPAMLHSFLADLNHYTPLHPLIESIEELASNSEMPRAKRYRVVDRIPLGPFKLRTVYIAALEAISDREIHGHAWQFPSIRLHTLYVLTETANGTHLEESVQVTAPRILRRFVVDQARRAHAETLSRMKHLLEAESDRDPLRP